MVSPVTYGSVNEFPQASQNEAIRQGVSIAINDMNTDHENRKEEKKEIDSPVYNNG
jgi:hypothetical protein